MQSMLFDARKREENFSQNLDWSYYLLQIHLYKIFIALFFSIFLALCDMNRGENNPILFFCSRVFQASCLLFYRTVKPQVPLLVCPIF